jgi:hypothetical protein
METAGRKVYKIRGADLLNDVCKEKKYEDSLLKVSKEKKKKQVEK